MFSVGWLLRILRALQYDPLVRHATETVQSILLCHSSADLVNVDDIGRDVVQ
jgi:hypothetical protein